MPNNKMTPGRWWNGLTANQRKEVLMSKLDDPSEFGKLKLTERMMIQARFQRLVRDAEKRQANKSLEVA